MATPQDILLRSCIPAVDAEVSEAFERFLLLTESKVHLSGGAKNALLALKLWFRKNGSLASLSAFKEWLRAEGEEETASIVEVIGKAAYPERADFDGAIIVQRSQEEQQSVQQILHEAADISLNGRKVPVDKAGKFVLVPMRGPQDAAAFLAERASVFLANRAGSTQLDSRETLAFRADYLVRERNPGESTGILTGVAPVDVRYRGMSPGDVVLVAGFAGHGKSMVTMNMVNTALQLGYNGVLFSLEMTAHKCQRTLVCIRAATYLPMGISYDRLRDGTLREEERIALLEQTLPSFEASDTGRLRIVHPDSRLGIDEVLAQAEAINREFEVDFIAVDYIGLLETTAFSDFKDSLNELIKRAKAGAMSFDKGRGVPLITPFQTNRKGYEDAKAHGGVYEITALSHANEAERTADLVVAVFADDDQVRAGQMVVTMLKARDSGIAPPFSLMANFGTRVVFGSELHTGSAPEIKI